MIDDEPVIAEVLYDFLEFAKIYWLLNVTIHAELIPFDHIALLAGRGHHDDRHGTGARVVFEFFEHFQAIELRQLQIEKNHLGWIIEMPLGIGISAKKEVQCLLAVTRDMNFVAEIVFTQRQ